MNEKDFIFSKDIELDGIVNGNNFYDPTGADVICDCEAIHSDSQGQYDYEDILLECFQGLIEQYGGQPTQSCLSNFVFSDLFNFKFIFSF